MFFPVDNSLPHNYKDGNGGYGPLCQSRKEDGYVGGMGEIFRSVASINMIITGDTAQGSELEAPATTTKAEVVTTPEPNLNILELAQSSSDLSTLVTALQAGNLVSALEGSGPFTVFAPSNAAFAKLPSAELERLLDAENVAELADILKYHVVSGAAVYSTDLQATQDVMTLQGQDVSIATSHHDGVSINGISKVISADNAAANGVVHIIDTVLLPPKSSIVELAQSSSDLSTLVTTLEAGNVNSGTEPHRGPGGLLLSLCVYIMVLNI